MKIKKITALFLTAVLACSLVACSAEEEPKESKKDLTGLKDEEIIEQLLADYSGMDFPAVCYETDLKCDIAGTAIAMTAEVSVKDDAMSFSSETSVGETSVTADAVFVDGMLYLDTMGEKVKTAATSKDADEAIGQQMPFVLEDLGVFDRRDLLRSEEGAYVVVLSQPKDTLIARLELDAFLRSYADPAETEDGSEEEGEESSEDSSASSEPYISRLGECYLSLQFSEDGILQKMSLGVNASFVSGGMESEMVLDLVYWVRTTDPGEISVKAPSDASKYEDLSPETTDTDGAADGSSGTSGSGDTTDSEDD